MLEFITGNKDLLSVISVTLAGLFVFIKWLDTRNNELKEQRYKSYMELVSLISGNKKDSTPAKLTEMTAAVWFLLEYKEYYEITKRIFRDSDLENMAEESWVQHVLPHIKKLLKEIS